jgi:hypothetical protein
MSIRRPVSRRHRLAAKWLGMIAPDAVRDANEQGRRVHLHRRCRPLIDV